MALLEKRITDLVAENYVYASVLHYFGIQFYQYSEQTLAQVCVRKGLNISQITKSLEAIQHQPAPPRDLMDLPIDLVIEYLRHTHYVFVKHNLPYMAKLIEDLPEEKTSQKNLARDLKMLFPLFVDDFIHHIHEEEATFFTYIYNLHKALQGQMNPMKLYYQMEKSSIQFFALDHHTHDDEMRGIREITNNYHLEKTDSLHLKVIFEELKALEHNLQTHAKIEDEILFIKALQLEKQVKAMLTEKIKWN
jgi:regulator of cell morphogenesis and NO signaling